MVNSVVNGHFLWCWTPTTFTAKLRAYIPLLTFLTIDFPRGFGWQLGFTTSESSPPAGSARSGRVTAAWAATGRRAGCSAGQWCHQTWQTGKVPLFFWGLNAWWILYWLGRTTKKSQLNEVYEIVDWTGVKHQISCALLCTAETPLVVK